MFGAKGTDSDMDTVSNFDTRHNSVLPSSSEAERGLSESISQEIEGIHNQGRAQG